MRRFVLIALLLAAGCTPVPSLEQRLQPWVGRSELDLVSAFGVPAGTYTVDGVKFLQFTAQRTVFAPGPAPMVWAGGPYAPYWAAAAPQTLVVSCEVTFALREAVVQAFSYRGEGCR